MTVIKKTTKPKPPKRIQVINANWVWLYKEHMKWKTEFGRATKNKSIKVNCIKDKIPNSAYLEIKRNK